MVAVNTKIKVKVGARKIKKNVQNFNVTLFLFFPPTNKSLQINSDKYTNIDKYGIDYANELTF